jgi:hypothetical protein
MDYARSTGRHINSEIQIRFHEPPGEHPSTGIFTFGRQRIHYRQGLL